jgi:hypothetical protein
VYIGELSFQPFLVLNLLTELGEDRSLAQSGVKVGAPLGVDRIIADVSSPLFGRVRTQHTKPEGRHSRQARSVYAVEAFVGLAGNFSAGVKRLPVVMGTTMGQSLGRLLNTSIQLLV